MSEQKSILGQTPEGRPVELWQLTQGPVPLLLLGGVHGDEPEGYTLVERFMRERGWSPFEGRAALWVIPRVNPDGCARAQRGNSRGVDLNRNMPTRDWNPVAAQPRYAPGPAAGSEVETQLLMKAIESIRPRLMVSAHSWKPMINYNGPCRRVAEEMSALNGYRISDDIGYPTPGSLGTWAGWERSWATITLEIEEELDPELAWSLHGPALMRAFDYAVEHEDLNR